MVLNALRKQKHISHFTLEEAIEMVEDDKSPRSSSLSFCVACGQNPKAEKKYRLAHSSLHHDDQVWKCCRGSPQIRAQF